MVLKDGVRVSFEPPTPTLTLRGTAQASEPLNVEAGLFPTNTTNAQSTQQHVRNQRNRRDQAVRRSAALFGVPSMRTGC